MRNNLVRLLICVFAVMFCLGPSASAQFVPPKIVTFGDSLTDEYYDEPQLPGSYYYGNDAKSWTQILHDAGKIDLGFTAVQAGLASWPDVRGTGHKRNCAVYGYTAGAGASVELPIALQVIQDDGVEYAIIILGTNDFNPATQAYVSAYNGTGTQAEAATYVTNSIVGPISIIISNLKAQGVTKIGLAAQTNFDYAPFSRQFVPDPEKRERAYQWLTLECRNQLLALAAANCIVFVDLQQLVRDYFGDNYSIEDQMYGLNHGDPDADVIYVGNQPTHRQDACANGGCGTVPDGLHWGSVFQGVVANVMSTALNVGYGTNITILTEAQILALDGISYGGANTLSWTIQNYHNYVYVPCVVLTCPGDYNHDNVLSVQDIFDFLNGWFAGCVSYPCDADANHNGTLEVADIFYFLNEWFAGCTVSSGSVVNGHCSGCP